MTNEIESLTSDLNSRRTGGGGSPMLFAVVGLALLLAAYAHWRFGQFDERIDRVRGQVAELRTEQDRLAAQIETVGTQQRQYNEQVRTQILSLGEVPAQIGELGQSVAELRARTDAPQRSWVRAEALYLLELSGRRLRLEHDVPTAIAALESADARLATVSDSAVTEVRAALARELAALRAVNVPDIGSVLARLSAIEANVPSFPVLGVPVASARRLEPPPATEIRRRIRACRTPAARGMGRSVLLSTRRSVALAARHARGRSTATTAVLAAAVRRPHRRHAAGPRRVCRRAPIRARPAR